MHMKSQHELYYPQLRPSVLRTGSDSYKLRAINRVHQEKKDI